MEWNTIFHINSTIDFDHGLDRKIDMDCDNKKYAEAAVRMAWNGRFQEWNGIQSSITIPQ